MATVEEAKELLCEMCRNFYTQGWVSGTGGGMSIKVGDKIVMAPSGVQKERMEVSDLFVLDKAGEVLVKPEARPPPYKPPKLSECSPLFMSAYELRNAGAVLHSHSMNAVMATMLQNYPGNGCVGEFRVTNLEMIKGIAGHGYFDQCVVPIIENTAREAELTSSLREAIANYPKANAVLVKRHGVYVWGDNWIQAKTQAECYEYLFEAAVKLHQLGLDVSQPPSSTNASLKRPSENATANGHAKENGIGSKRARTSPTLPKAVVLDIEGTITPLSYVTDKLYPYARQHLKEHLETTFGSEETQQDIDLLVAEAKQAGSAAGVAKGSDLASVDRSNEQAVLQAVENYVTTLMTEDKKSTGLKSLQGHIWRQGFASGELKAEFFSDVLPELEKWHAHDVKIFIYSSGSREAQRNLFANTAAGDIRKLISGFFDTTSGSKLEKSSYVNIAQTIGVDASKDIAFLTDNIKEAVAAREAGWNAILVHRKGNPPLSQPESGAFTTVTTSAGLF